MKGRQAAWRTWGDARGGADWELCPAQRYRAVGTPRGWRSEQLRQLSHARFESSKSSKSSAVICQSVESSKNTHQHVQERLRNGVGLTHTPTHTLGNEAEQ